MNARLSAQFEMVSPEIALQYLSANRGNRAIRQRHVDFLSGMMQRGAWQTTHQGIAFDITGTLVDGQHRLHAIVKSGETCALLVVRGLSPNATEAMDRGKTRSIADLLRVGQEIASVATTCARIVGHISAGTPAADVVKPFVETFAEPVAMLMDACPTTSKTASSSPVRLAFSVRLLTEPERTEELLRWYRSWVLRHSEEWPPMFHQLARQIEKGSTKARDFADLFLRVWKATAPVSEHVGSRLVAGVVRGERTDTRQADATVLARRVLSQAGLQ